MSPGTANDHTTRIRTVLDAEREYLERRRRNNELPSLSEDDDLWGISFSGGGVRSATFCLGVLQALTRKNWMKRFDYLSTVSGGGYIGSCLSSLLTDRPDTGMDDENSPFTGLRDKDDYADPEHTKLSVRHQIHHLRTHGEYLIPRSHVFSRDVQRALGSALAGMGHTIALFLLFFVASVAIVHLALTGIERDLAVLTTSVTLDIPGAEEMGYFKYVKAVLGAWYEQRLAKPVTEILAGAGRIPGTLLLAVVFGFLWCLGWIWFFTRLARKFNPKTLPDDETRAGWTAEDQSESLWVRRLNLSSVVVAIVLTRGLAFHHRIEANTDQFLAGVLLPLGLALGGLAAGLPGTYLAETILAKAAWWSGGRSYESRFRRSLYGSLRGACLYGTVAAAVLPVLVVLLFALSDLPLMFFWALAALAWAYYLNRKSSDASTVQLGGWLRRPLANLAVLLFLAIAFAQVSAWLVLLYRMNEPAEVWLCSLLVTLAAFVLFALLGTLIDANRVALHYFYRDRLTEAYLKTDARTLRNPSSTRQGMPLTVLRDDEDLKLSKLGKDNERGPYHLIVAALNLIGSQELKRKSFLSEHFIFSRFYMGSRVTGWVKTEKYRKDTTRLARAMAISAAAVGSAMGHHTFGAQAFVMTLFNARLGYWMENPWTYRDGKQARWRYCPNFWPWYLMLEVFGLTSARGKMVNLSDGGHTGDNLGLLPLLSRRCSTVVVCDAEADGNYSFSSFNNAVRMARIEENIKIDIDLASITDQDGSEAIGVAEGDIVYPEDPERKCKLVYIKAMCGGPEIPVHVTNYAKEHSKFPHETTVDQFFDDAQFEAYRTLGAYLGGHAAKQL